MYDREKEQQKTTQSGQKGSHEGRHLKGKIYLES